MIYLTLYGTAGCHLCEAALAVVRETSEMFPMLMNFKSFDIADDPTLSDRYALRIPVLQNSISQAEIDWPFDVAKVVSFISSS